MKRRTSYGSQCVQVSTGSDEWKFQYTHSVKEQQTMIKKRLKEAYMRNTHRFSFAIDRLSVKEREIINGATKESTYGLEKDMRHVSTQ